MNRTEKRKKHFHYDTPLYNRSLSPYFCQRLIIICLIGLCILSIPFSALAFNVTAQVDRNQITINDTLVLKIIFEEGEDEVDTSALTDFEILSRSSSSNISYINGKYSKTISANYRLAPRKEGRLSIPSFEVRHKGKVYTTKPITIQVVPADARPKASKDIFIEAGLSSTSLYVGQQVIYQLRLFSAIRFSNATLQQPDFSGFTAKEVGDRQNNQTTINGRAYRVIAVNYVLIPEATGEIEIDPAIITCDVPIKGRRSSDPFDDPFFSNNFFSFGRSEKRRFSTGPLSVKVDPLPQYTESHPPFSGVVGEVTMSAELDRDRLAAGESVTLTVTLSGKGNLMDAQSPEIMLPSDVKVYEDAPVEEMELSKAGYSGKKVFKKAIVPVTAGEYTIDPIAFSFFNIHERQYEVITAPAMTFTVTPSSTEMASEGRNTSTGSAGDVASGAGLSDALNSPIRKKERVEMTGRDILGLKEANTVLIPKKRLSMLLFSVLFFLPVLLFYLLKLYLFIGKKEVSLSAALEKRARETLSLAEHSANGTSDEDREQFLKSLHGALVKKVLAKAGKKGETLTADEVKALLMEAGCDDDVSDQVNTLLGEIDSARYGHQKEDAAYREALLTRAKRLFQTIGIMALMVSTVFFAAPEMGHCQSEEGHLFYDGIDAYHEGRYADAADLLERIVKKGVNNPGLYYNIGNAYLKAGQVGPAILWYERAKKELPFDPDLKFNLAYAEALVTDKVDPSFEFFNALFFWQDDLPTELLKYTAVSLSALFFLYAGFRTVRRKKVLTVAGSIGCAVWIVVGMMAFYATYHSVAHRRAVILSSEASVRSGTSSNATELFVLHAGTRVKVETVREGYLKIFFSKGKIGWVSRDDAEII